MFIVTANKLTSDESHYDYLVHVAFNAQKIAEFTVHNVSKSAEWPELLDAIAKASKTSPIIPLKPKEPKC